MENERNSIIVSNGGSRMRDTFKQKEMEEKE